jgi:hypothetical protein
MTHHVTDETRQTVRDLKAFGINNHEIADYLGICHDVLEKKYKPELKKSRLDKVRSVANCLYQKALHGDVTAQIFYLKTQGRWRTEDSKQIENDEEILKELKELRANLDAKNRKDY